MSVLRRLGRFRQRSRRYTRTAGGLIVPSWHTRPDSSVAAGHSIIASAAGTSSPTTATRASHTYREVNASGVVTLTDIADDNFPVDTIVDANGRVFTGVRNWPAATNLIEDSEDLTQWNKTVGTDSLTSDKITEGSATGVHRFSNTGVSFTTGDVYIYKAWVKSIYDSWMYLQVHDPTGPHFAFFKPYTGSKGNIVNSTSYMESKGDGWYECIMKWTHGEDATRTPFLGSSSDNGAAYVTFAGRNTDIFYAKYMDLKKESIPSQYIKTTGSSASRAAGTLIHPAATNIPNIQQGTLAFEFWHPNFTPAADTTIFQITDGGSTSDRIRFYVDTSGYLNVDIDHTGGTTRTPIYSANVCDDVVHSCHVSYIDGRAILAVDGAIRDTNTSIVTADIPNDLDQIEHTESCAVLGDIFFLPHPQFKGGFRYA